MKIGVLASLARALHPPMRRELDALCRRGHRVRVVAIRHDPRFALALPIETRPLRPLLALLGQPFFALSRPRTYGRLLRVALSTRSLVDFALAWSAARQLRGSDVVFATFADHNLFIGYYASRILSVPLASGVHCFELYDSPNPRLLEIALAACARIQTVTEYNASLLLRNHAVSKERLCVVRCTVPAAEDTFALLVVAYFEERKGYDTLFAALQRLDLSGLRVWVVGDRRPGALSRRERAVAVDARRLAEERGVSDRVIFFGHLEHDAVLALMARCDAFCLPSRADSLGICEGFPVVLAEAMAAGKPILATRHAGIPEAIPNVLVEEEDAAGLAEAIADLVRNPEVARKLGAENRAAAERLFSSANFDLLEDLLGAAIAFGSDAPDQP